MAGRKRTQPTPQQGALTGQEIIGGMPDHAPGGADARDPHVFDELDEVALTTPVYVKDLGRELPAGARGTFVGVWQGGRAYEVEFAEPSECLVTVPAGRPVGVKWRVPGQKIRTYLLNINHRVGPLEADRQTDNRHRTGAQGHCQPCGRDRAIGRPAPISHP